MTVSKAALAGSLAILTGAIVASHVRAEPESGRNARAVGSTPSAAPAAVGAWTSHLLAVERERAGLSFGRFDADRRLDMLLADDSAIHVKLQRADGTFADPISLDVGSELGGGLIQTVDLDGDGRLEVAVLHRAGVRLYRFDLASRTFAVDRDLLSGQRGISFLHLAREDFLFDVDRDGKLDLLFPVNGRVYVYVQRDGAFERSGEIATGGVEVNLSVGSRELGRSTRTRIALPRLRTEENDDGSRVLVSLGDGRLLRSTDGTAAVVGEYTIQASDDDPLAAFKQRHGIALESTDSLQAILRDLDDDGENDYTIVYKNRIWVYKGSDDGFDFDRTPDQLLKVSAADRLSVILLPLDGDRKPDLVIFKYRVPSVARAVAALAIGLRSDIEVLGYLNDGDPVFSRRPNHRSTFVVKVPPLLSLVGRIEEIAADFQDILRPMQSVSAGDFDGDGRDDVVRLSGSDLELYISGASGAELIDLGAARGREFLQAYDGHKLVVSALFDRRRKDVTLESAMNLLGDVVGGLQSAIVAEREVSGKLPIDPEYARRVDQILCQDLDGDGRDDIILFYDNAKDDQGELIDPDAQTLQIWLSAAEASGAGD